MLSMADFGVTPVLIRLLMSMLGDGASSAPAIKNNSEDVVCIVEE
jgi:hypothetical protein